MPEPSGNTAETLSLADLSKAIGQLGGACNRLEASLGGVNDELDEANQRLARALESRQAALAYLESTLAAIPGGVVVVDPRGVIVLFNQAAEALTGYSAGEVKGRHYSSTLGRGTSQKLTPLYTLATGSWIVNHEKELPARSGEPVPVNFSTSLVVDQAGGLVGAVEVLTDLTRMKLLEEEVARTRTLATIGELAAEVAHEIRNPLGGIKGFASLLKRDLTASPRALELVDKILEGIGALEHIVGDLLETGQPATLSLEHVDLASELRRILDMFDLAASGEGKAVVFKTDFAEEPCFCRVDRVRLTQAVTNLVRNAADAVGDTGTVTVRLYAGTASGSSARGGSPARTKHTREYLTVEVADTGPGVADDLVEKLFSPFFTTKSEGTGLGLAAVRRAAALHGGEARYRRGEPEGSRFLIEIPRR